MLISFVPWPGCRKTILRISEQTIGHANTKCQFRSRLIISITIIVLAITLWKLANVLLLLFGAVLLAIGLRAATRRVSRLTGLPNWLTLTLVIVVGTVAIIALFWIFGTALAAQFDNVVQTVPAGFNLLIEKFRGYAYGPQILEQARGVNVLGATSWITSMLTIAARSIAMGVGYVAITFFVAIYLAAQPERYRHLALRLVPSHHRAMITNLFNMTGDILQRWLIGQFVIMAVIGVLSGLGLWLLGIEAAFTLGLIGGLLCFIPYIGAILAAVPATLVALTQGPAYAAMVILMYAGVHFIEGNFITPLIQAEATSLPPVMALLSTVVFSLLFGPTAVLLAAPLTLFLMTAVELLYVQGGLGKPPEQPEGKLGSLPKRTVPELVV